MSRVKKSDEPESSVAVLTPTSEEREVYVPKTKEELLKEKLAPFIEKEGRRMVKGRFRHYEVPGGRTTVTVKKYKDVPQFSAEMIDEQEYTIPLYVAKFLNGIDDTAGCEDKKIGTCSYVVHGFKWENGKPMPPNTLDDRGIPVPNTDSSKKTRRFGFESLEFEKAS